MKRIIILAAMTLLIRFAIVYGNDYYVNASTGSNTTGNGSSGTPWKTITYALGQITGSGHTLYVSAGTYDVALGEAFPILMKDGVSLVGAGMSLSFLNASNSNSVVRCVGIVDPSTRLEAFTLTGGGNAAQGAGIFISAGSALKVADNEISENSSYDIGGGIYISNSSPTVLNNVIIWNSCGDQGSYAGGIYLSNSAALIQGNIIVGNIGTGVYIVDSSPLIQDNIISSNMLTTPYDFKDGSGIYVTGSTSSPRIIHNLIDNNAFHGIECRWGPSRPKIINNTISDNTDDGIHLYYAAPDSISNNIISLNSGYGIEEDGAANDPGKSWYNLYFANALALYRDEGTTNYYTASSLNSSVAECANNISGDPLFVDKANWNYYIRSGSPAIDAGDPNSQLDPDATRADIGAFYFDQPSPRSLDSLALVALYDSAGGNNWTNNTNWKTANPIDSWYGVNVSSGRVHSIDLTYNNMTGRLPSLIGDLSELVILKLGSNNISGSIPVSVGGLTALQELYIHANQFTGSIPSSIGNLSNLRILYLQLNYLTGSIPAEIGNLGQVQLITVSGNNLSGSIPAQIGNLPNVTALYLNGNQFTGTIPVSLGNLTGLQYLTLSDNQLTGSIPAELGALSQLQWLWLASNQFSGSIPSEIGNLNLLTQLYLDHNDFIGNVPDLTGLTALTGLRINSNRISGLQDLSSISSLVNLIVDHNQLTFEDIEPNIGAPSSTFSYSPQDSVGVNKDTTVETGSALDLTITVGGTHNLYQWYKNGSILGGATSESYTIPSVDYSDSGTYNCQITNTVATALTLYSRTLKLRIIPSLRMTDSLSLVTLYDSTGGDNWTNRTNWKSSNPIETWYGVSVTNSRVTSLELGNNNLAGIIPSSIGNVSQITHITLASNNLSGGIPSAFGDLALLDYLHLSYNQLTGSIPLSIGNLTNIRLFTANNNRLTGAIPSTLGNLEKLQHLNLSDNQLSGAIPAEISNMDSLKDLILQNNQLTGSIPTSIGLVTQLRTVSLSNNQLTGSIPSQIGNLSSLTYLDLSDNQLTSTLPASMSNLLQLQQLYLRNNQLSGPIPAFFGNLDQLYHVYLGSNQFSGPIPEEIGSMSTLTELNIDNNLITGQLPATIGNLSHLQALELTHNQLSGSIPETLGNLTNLKWLVLDENHLSGSVPASIGNLTNLLLLKLNNNQLDDLPDLTSLDSLQALYIENNRLTFEDIELNIGAASSTFNYAPQDSVGTYRDTVCFTGSTFSMTVAVGGTHNQYQWIDENQLWITDGGNFSGATSNTLTISNADEVNSGIYSCVITNTVVTGLTIYSRTIHVAVQMPPRYLDSLALVTFYDSTGGDNWANKTNWKSSNPIDTWYGITLIDGRVNHLAPHANNLTGTIPSAIANLTALSYLYLDDNHLTGSIPVHVFSLTGLMSLQLQNNQFSGSIPSQIGNLSALNYLDMSGNQLSGTIPSSIGNLSDLEHLILFSNMLSGSIPIEIGNIPGLKDLSLEQNALSGSIPTSIGNLSQLENLGLYSNQLSGSIPASVANLANLQNLLLAHNQLSGPIPVTIGNLTLLEQLTLDNNQLTGSIPSEIGRLSNLQDLIISSNQFVDSVPHALTWLRKVKNLDMSQNRLSDLPNFTPMDSLKTLSIHNNKFTFEDIEPNMGAPSQAFTYSPQDSVGIYSILTMLQGTAETLSVDVGGQNNQYQWMKKGVDIPGATTHEYYKLYWDVPDSGDYICRITNTLATALTLYSRRIKVVVNALPGTPSNLTATAASSFQINLNWTAGTNTAKYRIYRSLTSGIGFSQVDSVNTPTVNYNSTGLSPFTTYYYHIVGVNQYGISLNSSEASAMTLAIAPSLGTPNLSNSAPVSGAAVTVTITAAGTSPTVKLFYGKTTQSQGDSLTMTFNGTSYSATIPGTFVTQEGVWYRLRAQNTGGTAFYPGANTKANISVTINDMTSIWNQSYFYGGIPAEQYFSIAMSMSGSLSLSTLWGAQTMEDGVPTNWRAWDFNQPSQSFVDVTSLSGDKAYFLFHREGSAQEIFNSVTSKKTNDPEMFDNFILKAGWNAVPWPFTFPANLMIKDADHDTIGSMWKLWGNSGWEQVTECSAFCGYMIYNKTGGDVTLGNVVSWTMAAAKPNIDQNSWRLRFTAESGEYRDAFNFAGVSDHYATLSEPEPLSIGKSITLNFKKNGETLSSDIRSAIEDGHVWDMVSYNTTGADRAVLRWDFEMVPSDLKIMLVDVTNNKVFEINETVHSYEFRTQKQNSFKVIAGNTSYVDEEVRKIKETLPREFSLAQNCPNPFNPSTTIGFDVARSGNVKIKVYNMLGQEVATLVDGYFETGKQSVQWNGKDALGRQVASGMYLYRLQVDKIAKTRKMILVK